MIPAVYAVGGTLGLAGLLMRADRLARLVSLLLARRRDARVARLAGRRPHAARACRAGRGSLWSSRSPSAWSPPVGVRRWPLALPFAACLAAPFRFPVHIGSQDANLLVPLYAVIGVAWLVLALDALHDRGPVRLPPRRFSLPLLLLLAWESASLAWSASATEGAKALAFYALPFGVLLAALVAHPPPLPRLADLLRVQVALALAFAAIGVYQVLRHDIWWNRKLMVSNAFSSFFRANSVFYDPSIFGRYEAVHDHARVRGRCCSDRCGGRSWPRSQPAWPGSGFSPRTPQSALLALCAGVSAGLVLMFGRTLGWLLLLGALAVGLGLLAVPSVRHAGVDRVTSKRSDLVGDGLRLFRAHPLAGVGPRRDRRRRRASRRTAVAPSGARST